MEKEKPYMIICDQPTYELLLSSISESGQPKPRSSEVRGFGGEIAAYVIAGTIGLKGLAALLNAIKSAIELGRVIKSVKVGDKEIATPTASQIDELENKMK